LLPQATVPEGTVDVVVEVVVVVVVVLVVVVVVVPSFVPHAEPVGSVPFPPSHKALAACPPPSPLAKLPKFPGSGTLVQEVQLPSEVQVVPSLEWKHSKASTAVR
jgi:hypothetical protein